MPSSTIFRSAAIRRANGLANIRGLSLLLLWGAGAAFTGAAVTGASSALDAFAVAFAGFFAVNSGYTCNSPGSVILLTLETAVGKLSLASLTALLVIKVSKVPNNMVLSSRLLVHRRKGQWTLSFRVGCLHFQKIHNFSIRLYYYGTVNDQWSIHNLKLGGMVQVDGTVLSGPEPWNIRHIIDDNSPLKDLDMDDRPSLEKAIEMFDVHIQGFDATTGRSCGLHKVFQWDKGTLVYVPEGEMTDVFVKMTPEQKNMSKANATKDWGIDWNGFNGITPEPNRKPT